MNPISIERFMFYEGRKLYGFRLEGGSSRPGIIATITSIIAEKGLDITYYSTTGTVRLRERGGDIIFIDFTASNVRPEDLAREFMALDFVDRVEIIRPKFKGFIIDDVSFPIMLGGRRAIIFSEPALRGFLIDFRKKLGTGGEAMLYHIGREVGMERARNINQNAERIGVKDLRDKLEMGMLLLQCLGYAIPEIVEFSEEPPYLKIRLQNSIECELGRGAGKPFSHYVRGMITGYASELLQRDLLAEETRCIAMGDPYCEFEVKPREG